MTDNADKWRAALERAGAKYDFDAETLEVDGYLFDADRLCEGLAERGEPTEKVAADALAEISKKPRKFGAIPRK